MSRFGVTLIAQCGFALISPTDAVKLCALDELLLAGCNLRVREQVSRLHAAEARERDRETRLAATGCTLQCKRRQA